MYFPTNKPQPRYLVHQYTWNAADFEKAVWHMPGEPCTSPERMSLQDVKELIMHAARNPAVYESFDYEWAPGIELIQRPISSPMTVRVIRILGITISELPINIMGGGY